MGIKFKLLLWGLTLFCGPLIFAQKGPHNERSSGRRSSSSSNIQNDRRGFRREEIATVSVPKEESEALVANMDKLFQNVYQINSGRKSTLPTN